jgi:hypothetical protein
LFHTGRYRLPRVYELAQATSRFLLGNIVEDSRAVQFAAALLCRAEQLRRAYLRLPCNESDPLEIEAYVAAKEDRNYLGPEIKSGGFPP